MTPLILSIGFSSLIFVIFKMFAKYGVDNLQAIIVNYLTAAGIGMTFFLHEWTPAAGEQLHWLKYVILMSFLLISLFFIMAKSSQDNGVASTSISVKMSMAISLLAMIIVYGEAPSFLKICGILLAITGVYLVSSGNSNASTGQKSVWMLIVLFLGNGVLDFMISFVQKNILTDLTPSLFTTFSLGAAGIIGFIVLLISAFSKPVKIQLKNLIAGFILGIPNFFSIYFLLLSYRTTGWTDTTVLSITNVSVVLTSALMGYILFKEQKSVRKLIGLFAAVLAIVTIYFSNK